MLGEGQNLMGRNCLKTIQLHWRAIFKLQIGLQQELNALLLQHGDVFKGELGTLVGATEKFYGLQMSSPGISKPGPCQKL